MLSVSKLTPKRKAFIKGLITRVQIMTFSNLGAISEARQLQGKTRQGKARQLGKERQLGKAKQGKTRQGKERKGKTR